MDKERKRFTLSLPDDICSDFAEVKRMMFYDKPFSEMYRELIRLGLDSLKQDGSLGNGTKNVTNLH